MKNHILQEILISQYKASLLMLRQVIENIPDNQWNSEEYGNPNWQIAYHTLWSVKYYLGPNPESYIPWQSAIEGAESLGGNSDWENPDEGVVVEGFHTKKELLEFLEDLQTNVQKLVESLPLDEHSGFEWYPYTRLELHINTIRHIQHHTAQLIERMKIKGISGFPWRVDGNPLPEW